MAKCPHCGHKWSYKERLFGYSLKLRTRIRCKNCKEYIEPSNLAIMFDLVAVIGLVLLVFIGIPFLQWSYWLSIGLSVALLLLYVFFFVPNTVMFKEYKYRSKKDFYKKDRKW